MVFNILKKITYSIVLNKKTNNVSILLLLYKNVLYFYVTLGVGIY